MRKVLSDLLSLGRSRSGSAHLEHLTHVLRRFTVERQHVPRDLRELVALKYLESIPEPPNGQRYVIDRKKVEVLLE